MEKTQSLYIELMDKKKEYSDLEIQRQCIQDVLKSAQANKSDFVHADLADVIAEHDIKYQELSNQFDKIKTGIEELEIKLKTESNL